MDPKDSKTVNRLLGKEWKKLSNGSYDGQVLDNPIKSSNYGNSDLSLSVLRDSTNQIAGFITYGMINDEPTQGHVEMLAVDQAARRHGVATTLLQHAQKNLKKWRKKDVYTRFC